MTHAHANAVFDHEAAASAAGDLAPPSQLAEFCCSVVVAVIAALMWRWWQHHSRYEAAQHARDAGGVCEGESSRGESRGKIPRNLEPSIVERGKSRRRSSAVCHSPVGAREEYEAPDAQQQRRGHRYAQLMGTLAAYNQELGDHAGSWDAHALDQPWLAHRRPGRVSAETLLGEPGQPGIPGYLCMSDTCLMAGVNARNLNPLAGPPNGSTSAGSTAPGGGPRTAASSGSRYTAQLLKRRNNAGGSVSPISRTTSSSSQISRTLSGNSPAISRTHSQV
jgi:hypothetical protein